MAGSPGPIVTAGGLIFVTGGGSTLYAIDTDNGVDALVGGPRPDRLRRADDVSDTAPESSSS